MTLRYETISRHCPIGLVQRRIRTEAFWLVAAPAYLARARLPLAPEDLDGMDGLFAEQGETGWALHGVDGAQIVTTLSPRYYANDAVGLLHAARAGLGIACLPTTDCRADLGSGVLARVLPEWTGGEVTTTLLMPHKRGLLPSVRVVVDLLIEQLSRP